MSTEPLSIGSLAKATDTKVETIRYYESIGLLAAPARTKNNYRAYTAQHLARLSFIRRARALGFSIDRFRSCSSLPTRRIFLARRWTRSRGSISPKSTESSAI